MGFVPAVRSFLDGLWAVLAELEADKKETEAPRSAKTPTTAQTTKRRKIGGEPAAHTTRVEETLRWLRAFLKRLVGYGVLGRMVDIREWQDGPSIVIATDASPWGLGAVLEIDGIPQSFISEAITHADAERLGFEIGSCRGQSAAESLAILVAMRSWLPLWRVRRTAISVRSDSQAALGALGKLGSKAPAMAKVAREVALDIAVSRYGIDVWEHQAAEDNLEADVLSRWHEPGKATLVPGRLRHVERCVPEPRTDDRWLASSAAWRRRIGLS